ncbi:hypothetical protein LTR95_017304, partial [Oleoguttula sp. CCFEE 5521]
ATVTEWRSHRGRQKGRGRKLDSRRENPAMFKTLKKLTVEMRRQSRVLRGVAYPNDLLDEAAASGGTDGEVDLALRLATSPNV